MLSQTATSTKYRKFLSFLLYFYSKNAYTPNRHICINFILLTQNPLLNCIFYTFLQDFNNFFSLSFLSFYKNITIKNHFFVKFKKIRNYRHLFRLEKFKFKIRTRLNSIHLFFHSSRRHTLLTNTKPRVVANKKFAGFYFFIYKSVFKKNWNFLIGNVISPFYWELNSKKSYKMNTSDNSFFKIDKPRFFKKYLEKKNSPFLRKVFINNFFYLSNFFIKYDNFVYHMSLKTSTILKPSISDELNKPYLFLNNSNLYKDPLFYSNQCNYLLIKHYSSIFNFIKNSRYLPKKFNMNLFLKLNNLNKTFSKNYFKSRWSRVKNFTHSLSVFFVFKNQKNVIIKNRRVLKTLDKKKFVYNRYLLTHNVKKKKIRSKVSKLIKTLLFNIFKKTNKFNLFYHKWLFFRFFYLKTRKLKKIFTMHIFLNSKRTSKRLKINKIKRPGINLNTIFFKKRTFIKFYFFKSLFKRKFSNVTIQDNYLNHSFDNEVRQFNNYERSEIWINFKPIIFFSREKTLFLLDSFGFLNISIVNPFSHLLEYSHNLKKVLYSFTYKNEIHRFVLKRYQKTNFFSHFNSHELTELDEFDELIDLRDSTDKFSVFPNNLSNLDNYVNSFHFFNNYSDASPHFQYFSNFFTKSKKFRFLRKRIGLWRSFTETPSEFNIKRIRFKPGYMSQWREARKVLQTSLDLKFRYQYRLTRYLTRYNKYNRFNTYLSLEMQLLNVLIRSRFFPDNYLITTFLNNNLIFINGFVCNNPFYHLFLNDLIQLVVNVKYYILYKWLLNWTLKKKNRLKKVLRRKSMANKDTDEKKRSFLLPKWILFSRNSLDDVAKYLEIDYFTLSFFIVFEPLTWSELNYYNVINVRYPVMSLYNWKYIT